MTYARQKPGNRKLSLLPTVLLSLIAICGSGHVSPVRAATVASSGFEETDAAAVTRYMASGRPLPQWTRSATIARDLFAAAQAHGLWLDAPPVGIESERAAMLATLRLARALAQGAVPPSSVQSDWFMPIPNFDPDAALGELAASDDPLSRLSALAPSDEEYARLQQALIRYRKIAQDGGWPAVPGGVPLKLGAAEGRMHALRQRLSAEGDLAAGAPGDGPFDRVVEQAVRNFQARHGLAIDGRVGGETLTSLNIDAETRYRQIAANLERWRWLPRRLPPNRIMVNAAAAQLTLVEDGKASLLLRTVVGLPKHPTPVFAATVESVLLNPPWNIPASIAAHEIRPRERRDPGYFEREGIVTRDNGQLQQLPGPKNALGRVKFELPNPMDVYLHDTPAKHLFQRPRRFFSHGCIRVDDPRRLALALLQRDGRWTGASIDQAIDAGATQLIHVAPAIRIYVTYFTSTVDANGVVAFYDDPYGRDAPLIAMLIPQQVVAMAGGNGPLGSVGCGPSS